jgi:hypothetical protein
VAVASPPSASARPFEAWIAADPARGGLRVLITGPQGFERSVAFKCDEAVAAITTDERVRETKGG